MTPRLDYIKAAPDAFKAILGLENYVAEQSGLDPHLIHLIKLRASQINGCAFCVDMHTREARKHGLGEQWIALVCVWREAPIYDARERAVLGWTEALTNLSTSGAPDADFDALRVHFDDDEIVKLTTAIATINVWNRVAVGFRSQPAVEIAA